MKFTPFRTIKMNRNILTGYVFTLSEWLQLSMILESGHRVSSVFSEGFSCLTSIVVISLKGENGLSGGCGEGEEGGSSPSSISSSSDSESDADIPNS